MTTVGLVGCGHISAAHLNGWARSERCEVTTLFDTDRELAERRRTEFGIPTVARSLTELIERVDLVDICTPPKTHAAIVTQSLRASRQVLVEKPVVTTVEEWEDVVDALGEDRERLSVIHNLKFAPSIQRAIEVARRGDIGQVISVDHEFLTDPTTDRMLAEPHWSHELLGGRWSETLPHPLYLFHAIAGPLGLVGVAAVDADSDLLGTKTAEAIVTLASENTIGTIRFSGRCHENRRMLTIQGSSGRIVVDELSDAWWIERRQDSKARRVVGISAMAMASAVAQSTASRATYVRRRIRGETPHSEIIEHIGRFLNSEGPPPTPFDEIDYVVRMGAKISERL